jgi:hypothetical protein
MTLIIQKPTGAKLNLRKELPADAEADAYIAAVEAADGQALESGVKFAIKNFVLCCKQDGIWNAIKASCILAGARTRLGALTPLVGTAPTSINFINGDYNRKTGLLSSGSQYLVTNRLLQDSSQDNIHIAAFPTSYTVPGSFGFFFGAGAGATGSNSTYITSANLVGTRNQNSIADNTSVALSPGFLLGTSRSSSASYQIIARQVTSSIARLSQTPHQSNILMFSVNNNTNPSDIAPVLSVSARLAFYSIGESLNLALLDARVTDLINAFGAAIP